MFVNSQTVLPIDEADESRSKPGAEHLSAIDIQAGYLDWVYLLQGLIVVPLHLEVPGLGKTPGKMVSYSGVMK